MGWHYRAHDADEPVPLVAVLLALYSVPTLMVPLLTG